MKRWNECEGRLFLVGPLVAVVSLDGVRLQLRGARPKSKQTPIDTGIHKKEQTEKMASLEFQ